MLFDPALRMGRALSFCCEDKLPLAGSLDVCLGDTELVVRHAVVQRLLMCLLT